MVDTSSRTHSQEQFERACRSIPGGVNSPARAFGAVGGTPPFIQRGDGPYLVDIDDNQFIDFVGSWGPHILGHRHPAVIEAIQQAIETGTSFGAPTVSESDLAELVVELVPGIEKVRMVNSGTEATMSAIRLARGFTGRNVVVKFAGCYHGHVDSLLVQAGSGALTLGAPSSPGVPAGCTADTLVLSYNDVAMLRQAFEQQGDSLAAVILEPVCGNMGCVIPTDDFLRTLRQLCTDHGTVLIFDEVMTGFRVDLGCAQARLGVTPDLTTLGKIIGGGMPVGAYGGRADIMDAVSPVGAVYQAGTLSGNPIAMASGLATLQQLQQADPYEQLEHLAAQLEQGFRKSAAAADVPVQVNRVGSMLTLFFNENPVTDLQTATASDTDRFARWFHAMLDRGVYLPCSQFEALFVSAAHTPELIEQTIAAASEAMQRLSNPA
ncbi:MAG: glutamate-1-semialdehyde 2,1-aminomutase [Fuerstiella sp.]|jgi:glutamate-1-semialdehyde 2,1-aminomutase|nr:glutamate-1-semialdehyde 2,1-aminomutase [Fuerstiella sp.]